MSLPNFKNKFQILKVAHSFKHLYIRSYTFTLTGNPNSPYTLSIDSFGLSSPLSRGENSVATRPGDIPY